MGKSVLMVAFHFPPAAMGSGHLRTLGFARNLPAFGWQPVVLTARALAYPRASIVDGTHEPSGYLVHRALAFDASRHFSVGGKYPGFLAQPDRWSSWWPAAVLQGLRLIRRHHVRAIWSTYPIMTAHCIGRTLSRIARIPWIADFRDPVASSVEASNPYSVASQRQWEQRVLAEASRVIFTTHGGLAGYAEDYPEAHLQGRLAVIENGYDEFGIAHVLSDHAPSPPVGRPIVLVHSGQFYAEGRNPAAFLVALARLNASGKLGADVVRVILRGNGSVASYAGEIQRLGLGQIVTLAPLVSNRKALAEQAGADGLLLFQGSLFDRQIPAKVYEYLGIGQPIFAMVGENGDTAALLRKTGGADIVAVDDVDAIAARLDVFIQSIRNGCAARPPREIALHYSRRARTGELAGMLDQLVAGEAES